MKQTHGKGGPRGSGNCISLTHSSRPHPGLAKRAIGKSAAESDRFVGASPGTAAADHRERHRSSRRHDRRTHPHHGRLYARAMPIPEPMLSTRAAAWPAQGDWMMEPKWDGFRLLVAIDHHGRVRAWSRRGTSLGDRLGSLLEPLAESPRGTVFDAELVALSSRDGRAVQDFAAVCRATLQADAAAATEAPPRCLRPARARRRRRPIAALGQAHRAPAGDFSRRRPAPAHPDPTCQPRRPRPAGRARV